MASRIIHLAIAKEISAVHPTKDGERFRLGSVLPDASPSKASHFNKYIENNTRKTHDLTAFRQRYGEKIQSDELYLGYYLHLLEDVLFRHYMFEVIGFDPRPEGNIARLHQDYQLTNRYVAERYGLKGGLSLPENLAEEPLLQEYAFEVEDFLREMEGDFANQPSGKTVFFTEEMAQRYIELAVKACLQELDALQGKAAHFDEDRYSWKRG